ncbi:CLUMA_CG021084, isoform A [Clunio marinus]|uniref:CLUMA_CG021084, isoform A n=1 Tax=Clunio marinus TaxID=568069 RepID=A0A1J1J6H0_9DIPT|nr:CLUMA_CG021084, isoform A [Clunio marinus]
MAGNGKHRNYGNDKKEYFHNNIHRINNLLLNSLSSATSSTPKKEKDIYLNNNMQLRLPHQEKTAKSADVGKIFNIGTMFFPIHTAMSHKR